MFRLVIFVVVILNQVEFHTTNDCSTTACLREPCNITREVSPTEGAVVWRRDTEFVRFTAFPCTDPQTDLNYSVYCMDTSVNRHYILEIYHPEYHDFSNFTDSITSDVTTFNLRVPDSLRSADLTTNIPDTITEDIFSVSVSVPCSKPQPTFTWNFQASKSKISYTTESNQTSTDNTGCTSPLFKRESLLIVNPKDWDPEFTKTNGDIDISVDLKFGECKTISSSPVTVKYIVPGSSPPTSSESPQTRDKDITIIIIIIIPIIIGVVIVVLVILFCFRCPLCPYYKKHGPTGKAITQLVS